MKLFLSAAHPFLFGCVMLEVARGSKIKITTIVLGHMGSPKWLMARRPVRLHLTALKTTIQ